MACSPMPKAQYDTETFSSLQSLRTIAHNYLRLALEASDHGTQDLYLTAARQVLEQMEDAFDTLQLNTTEDAVAMLALLENGDGRYSEGANDSDDDIGDENEDHAGSDVSYGAGEAQELRDEETYEEGEAHDDDEDLDDVDNDRQQQQGNVALDAYGNPAYHPEWNAKQ
jgi:hypothetical protein